jgi:3-dehydro-L-gulonate 2-dehydrogenase
MLSGGLATHQIPRDPLRESGISQMFIAINPLAVGGPEEMTKVVDGIVQSLRDATPVDADRPVRYPGEQTLALREENMRLGVPVDADAWKQLNEFS